MQRIIPLNSGILTANVRHAEWTLDDLCTFAARDNPKRAFLVVSNVLGRHVPTRPSVMRASFRDLAKRVPDDLPGPVLVIGMAETAICLGQGVHEELLHNTKRTDILFLHSTRQIIDHPVLCRFEEPHSHASSHILYRPGDFDNKFAHPKTVIIVDDEISTGTTISNLAAALVAALPSLDRIVAVALTDWSLGVDWSRRLALPCDVVSLLSGHLHCDAYPVAAKLHEGFETAANALGAMKQHHNFGRLGRSDVASEGDELIRRVKIAPKSNIRVLGTGEFTYPSFRIAEKLEEMGHDVVMQSTTRSPVKRNEVIRSKIAFRDNYGTAVPNYIYNVDPAEARATIICHETPAGSVDPDLVSVLNAQTLAFGAAA
jgi:Phosphoribosyl transferase/TRSP domain C terminus to PRTase_2